MTSSGRRPEARHRRGRRGHVIPLGQFGEQPCPGHRDQHGADATRHEGEYRKIVEGVNQTLDAVVAPGTAMVMCLRVWSLSAPITWYQTDPNSGFARVPSFSAASSSACFLSPCASNRRFWAARSRLPMLVHSAANGCWRNDAHTVGREFLW